MRSCAACGGLIGEPGKAYGYVGRWCHCTKPLPNDYPHVQGFPHIQEGIMPPSRTLDDLMKIPHGPIVVVPPPEILTPTEFVHWLRGYVAAGGTNPAPIAEQLRKVKT